MCFHSINTLLYKFNLKHVQFRKYELNDLKTLLATNEIIYHLHQHMHTILLNHK